MRYSTSLYLAAIFSFILLFIAGFGPNFIESFQHILKFSFVFVVAPGKSQDYAGLGG